MTDATATPAWADLPAYRAAFCARNPVPPASGVIGELAARKQWLVWRYEPGETLEKKPRKMPYYASGGRRHGDQGDDRDRERLSTYDIAAAAAIKGDYDGVGFAFLPNDGLIGIDLDGMIDTETGEVTPRCAEIVKACASYTEYSPSGTGVHIICIGEAETFKSNKIGIEVFAGRQYFTFTGKPWGDSAVDVRPIDATVLRRLKATVKGSRKPAADKGPVAASAPTAAGTMHGGRVRSVAESVALAEEALQHLDADDYQQWIEIGMACKAGLGTAGFYVWDAWSSRSPKYANEADMRQRWNGFQPTQLTLGTVFGLAESAGWVSPWAKARAKAPRASRAAKPPPDPPTADEMPPYPPEAPAGGSGNPPEVEWRVDLLRKKGDVSPCLANAELILSCMKEWRGTIAFDEFAERTVFRNPLPSAKDEGENGDWSDHLDVMTAIWMQRTWGVEFSPTIVGQAVEALARQRRYHPVREALAALPPWDGTVRNTEWLSDFMGVKRTEYSALVGQFFLRGMIKRVMEPGCKFDYCLILEGEQGLGKSAAARILAWNWFGDTDLDLNNKDALLSLPGHWVYEIAEMGSLMKAEERKQKSFLSRQEDEYRPPYGKRLIKVPRQSVFIGTTNEEEYLKDMTGGRRFWPVLCKDELNLEGLRSNIEQMFAEALADYRSKERCWPTHEEQERLFTPEQAARGMPEPYEDLLAKWVNERMSPFSMAEAAIDGLKMTPDKLTPANVTRIGMALRKLGCGRKENRLAADKNHRRLYLSPAMTELDKLDSGAATAAGAASQNGEGALDVGF